MYCLHYHTCLNSKESLCDDNNCYINYKNNVDNNNKVIKNFSKKQPRRKSI